MTVDIKVFSGLSWGMLNSLNYADTQKYKNDSTIRTLKEVFGLPESIKDGYHYILVLTFDSDVVIGKKVIEKDSNGNETTRLVGKVYLPSRSPLVLQGKYIRSAFFGDDFLAFQNVSSTNPEVTPEFEANLAIYSPDPML